MNILKQLFGSSPAADLTSVMAEGAYLVDVRSPGEFANGSLKGSVNIPLDKITSQLAKLKNKKNIIVFCRSGNRSGQAKSILEQNGFQQVINGGSIDNVRRFVL